MCGTPATVRGARRVFRARPAFTRCPRRIAARPPRPPFAPPAPAPQSLNPLVPRSLNPCLRPCRFSGRLSFAVGFCALDSALFARNTRSSSAFSLLLCASAVAFLRQNPPISATRRQSRADRPPRLSFRPFPMNTSPVRAGDVPRPRLSGRELIAESCPVRTTPDITPVTAPRPEESHFRPTQT